VSAIDDKYVQLIEANPWIGLPAGDEQTCTDKVGTYREYKGGASIYYTPATGAHLIYGYIRDKWIALGREKGPNGYPTSDETDASSGQGRLSQFQQGAIVWKRGTAEAFTVYGAIYIKWGTLQYDKGPLGFPLTDEAAAAGNSGRFNDFEHGAIYYNGALGTHAVRSPILEAWTVADREKGLLKLPVSDTPAAADAQGSITQKFQGGSISCTAGASRSIVTSTLISPRIEPRTRSLVLEPNPSNSAAWKLPDIDDKRVCKLTRLNRHLRLKTALVIFPGSYTRTLTSTEIADLKSSYATAVSRIHDFSFGLGEIVSTVVEAGSALTKSDFTDYGKDGKPSTFQAEFAAYGDAIKALTDEGLAVGDFDVVSICIPWQDSDTQKASGFAWANPVFKLNNTKTWSTIHYIYPGDYWWAYFVHETTHCLEWMLQDHGYRDLRNNDDPWWAACYPKLSSSAIVPKPENTLGDTDPRLYAMHQRIKSSWLGLAPKWGSVKTDPTTLESYGQILSYACPDGQAIVETAWDTKYLGVTPSVSECQKIANELKGLYAERSALQADLQEAGPGGKAALAAQIKNINAKIGALADESAACDARAALLAK
jgi:hypothetical protein